MRTLNVRLAIICCVVALLLGAGVHLLYGFQHRRLADASKAASERAEDKYRENKKASEKAEVEKNLEEAIHLKTEADKNLDEANRLLQNYVALKPQDRKALLHLGLLFAEKSDNAFKNEDDDSRAAAAANAGAACVRLEQVLRTSDDGVLTKGELRKARRKLVEMSIRVNRGLEAKTHAELLLNENPKDPKDPEILDLYGQILVATGDYENARKQFEQAIKIAPSQIKSYEYLAEVLRAGLHHEHEADKTMFDMVKNNRMSVEAIRKCAVYFRASEKNDDALAQAKRLLELQPEDAVGLWIHGCWYLANGQYKTAEEFLDRGIKADKHNSDLYRTMAEVNTQRRQRDKAIEILRTGLENTKGSRGYVELLWELVNASIDNGKLKEAEKGLEELRDPHLRARPQLVDYVAARLAMAKGDFAKAMEILVDVLPKLHDVPGVQRLAYYLKGQCYRQLGGDVEGQITAYQEAVKIDRYFSPARAGLGEIFQSQGKLGDAAEQYAILVNGPHPDMNSAISLARIMIVVRLKQDKEKRDWAPVDDLLNQIEHRWEMNASLARLKAEVLLAKNSGGEAQKLLERCTTAFPDDPLQRTQVWLALINLPIYLGDNATDPAEKERRWQQASDFIDRAEQTLGDLVDLRMLRGILAIHRKDPQVTAVLKKLGENLGKMADGEKRYLWTMLGSLSVQANDLDLARYYYRLEAENDPKNIAMRCTLCDLNLRLFEKGQAPEVQELDKLVSEIEQLGGRDKPFWLYGKAIQKLMESKKKDPQLLKEAYDYLKKAFTMRDKDWPALAVLAGKICEMQDEPEQALRYYRRAVSMGVHDSDMIRRTVHLLLKGHDFENIKEAGQLFDYLEKQKSPLLVDMNQDYLLVRVFTGDVAEAAKDVAGSVPPNSRECDDLVRQGQLYRVLANRLSTQAQAAHRETEAANGDRQISDEIKRGKSEKAQRLDSEAIEMANRALRSLAKARDLNPQANEVWAFMIVLLLESGQSDKAPQLIAAAEESLKGNNASMTIAVCWQLLYQTTIAQAESEQRARTSPQRVQELRKLAASYAEKAQAKYEEAVKASPRNCRILRQVAAFYIIIKSDRAESLLKQIISLQSPETLNDVCWARRSLAEILKDRHDFDDFCKAMALIDENLRSNARSIEDEHWKIFFLLLDPRKEKIVDAIHAMEELVKGGAATPDDKVSLAQLYLKRGDWDKYNSQMRSVLTAQKGAVQPGPLVFYVNSLLEKKKLDDVDSWLSALEKAAPNQFDTVRLRAEYQFLLGNYKAAGDLPMAFLDNPNAEPKSRGQQLFLIASLMEKFSDRLKADGKRADARDFVEKADTLFTSLRSKRVSETGDILYASYLARQKRIPECLEVLEECSTKCPPDALRSAALTLIHSQAASPAQYQELEKILVAAADKSNRPVPLLLVLAALSSAQGQHDKSIADYREILSKDPRNYESLNNLGIDLARSALGIDRTQASQTLDEALKLVNEALAIRGPLAEVLDSRAVVYIVRQEPEKALEDLAAAIKDDGAAEQYFHQAWAYWLAGNKPEASTSFVAAMKKGLDRKDLDPREVSVYDLLQRSL